MATQKRHRTVWACAAIPWVVFALVVLVAALTSGCNANNQLKCQADVAHLEGVKFNKTSDADNALDHYFRFVGPAVPPLLLLISLGLLPFKKLIEAKAFEEHLGTSLLTNTRKRIRWTLWMCTLCIGIQLLRMALYPLMKLVNTYASDHVFLATSMMAQVQIIMTVAVHVLHQRQFKTSAAVIIVLSLALLIAINMEVFITAKFFHTVGADIAGLVSGYMLFGSAALVWTYKVDKHAIRTVDWRGNEQPDIRQDYVLLSTA